MNSVKKIFITGTPGVGKSSVSKILSNKLNAKLINISTLVEDKNLFDEIDEEKEYKIVDENILCREINKIIELETDAEFVIVDGHLSHFCKGADLVIILRVNPNILKDRLKMRNYSDSKIRENLEAEAIGVCSVESYEIHDSKACEIDVTNLSFDEILDCITDILYNNAKYPVGSVNFMDWLIQATL